LRTIANIMIFKLSPGEQTQLEKIKTLISKEIKKNGKITFARYMELALYTPLLGYYSSCRPKFGKEGDFVTAPEISPLFALCLAQFCKEVSHSLPHFQILEIGAGRGSLACDILQTLFQEKMLPEKYFILEISDFLKQEQKNKIKTACPHLLNHVEWRKNLPTDFNGVILANEVMDAFPVHRVYLDEQGIQEYYVSEKENHFVWTLGKPSTPLLETEIKKNNFSELPYATEINLLLPAWIANLGNCLKEGVVLLFDYGYPRQEYYHPERKTGTLRCHYQHHAHDNPLILTGLQDITAHVNFTQVAESAEQAGFELLGFTTQAHFLLNMNVLSYLNENLNLSQQAKRLIFPGEMGESIKVMGLGKNFDEPLQGFSMQDQKYRLWTIPS